MVIAIIGILVALLLPAVQSAREAARRTQCSNNLRQLATAVLSYQAQMQVFPTGEVHGGSWVSGYRNPYSRQHCDWEGSVGMWCNLIFPYIEQQSAFDKLDFAIIPQYNSTGNVEIMRQSFSLFFCPSDGYRGLTTDWGGAGRNARIMHYYAVNGSNEGSRNVHRDQLPGKDDYGHCNFHDGMFFNDSATKDADIKDGLSNTAMLCETWGRSFPHHQAESPPLPGYPTGESSRGMNLHTSVYFGSGSLVYTPNSNHMSPWRANSFHPGGVHLALADGSVHFIPDAVNAAAWLALATIAGQESVDPSKWLNP